MLLLALGKLFLYGKWLRIVLRISPQISNLRSPKNRKLAPLVLHEPDGLASDFLNGDLD